MTIINRFHFFFLNLILFLGFVSYNLFDAQEKQDFHLKISQKGKKKIAEKKAF